MTFCSGDLKIHETYGGISPKWEVHLLLGFWRLRFPGHLGLLPEHLGNHGKTPKKPWNFVRHIREHHHVPHDFQYKSLAQQSKCCPLPYPIPSGNLTQLLKMAIQFVDLPIKNGDFPQLCQFTRGQVLWHAKKYRQVGQVPHQRCTELPWSPDRWRKREAVTENWMLDEAKVHSRNLNDLMFIILLVASP